MRFGEVTMLPALMILVTPVELVDTTNPPAPLKGNPGVWPLTPKLVTRLQFGASRHATLPAPTRMLLSGRGTIDSPPTVAAAPFKPTVESSWQFVNKRAAMRA